MTKAMGRDATVAAATNRVGVLVLGMHRSGTSALARVLNLLGCDLPKTLMDASPANEAGYWESRAIMNLNDEILSSAGSNWRDWLAFNSGWYASPRAAEFKEKALTVLEEEFTHSRLFVLKDPRICRFAPFWLEVLERAGVQPAIIVPVRNPLEVAESLSSRDGIDPGLGHLLWLRYVLEAEVSTRGLPRFHISYEDLLKDWSRLISETQGVLGVNWPRLSVSVSEKIGAFLTERLRHHRESSSGVLDNPLLCAWLRETFAICNRWTAEGEASEDYAVLDRIRTELDAAAPAFSHLISSGQKSAQRAKALDVSLKEARARVQDQQAELANLQVEAQSLRAELEATRGQLSHTQSALAQRSIAADEAAAQLFEKTAKIAALEQMLRQKETEAGQARESATPAERDMNAQMQELRTEKSVVEGRLAERFSEIAAMTRLLDEKDRAALLSAEQAAWLREVSLALLNGSSTLKGWLRSLLPPPIGYARQKARLKRKGIFDSDAYLAAYPDVAKAGLDALKHYINHGMKEGRQVRSGAEEDK